MWQKFPQQFFFQNFDYYLLALPFRVQTRDNVCCTQKCAKVWYPYILGSTGLHYRSVAQITRGLIHLGFIPHAKLITSMCFQFPAC